MDAENIKNQYSDGFVRIPIELEAMERDQAVPKNKNICLHNYWNILTYERNNVIEVAKTDRMHRDFVMDAAQIPS